MKFGIVLEQSNLNNHIQLHRVGEGEREREKGGGGEGERERERILQFTAFAKRI